MAAPPPPIEVGLAVRDVTPSLPIWLAGYAARKKPADKVEHPLLVQAMAVRNPGGAPVVLVALDNCEASRAFLQPVYQQCADKHQLSPGAVMVVASHTHSGPVLNATLESMYPLSPDDRRQVEAYSKLLQGKLVEVVGAALADFQPALLEQGRGQATFAMNRRVYQGDKMAFGNNPDAPVDWDVPVLRVTGTNGAPRAILFGYSCHGTTVSGGDDWYSASGDYIGFARQYVESLQPGATAMFLTGMGADSNPAPRGSLLEAKRHGMELAGAVIGVLGHPMLPVRGAVKLAYEEVDLPLADQPGREQLEKDSQSADIYIKYRAKTFLKKLDDGEALPQAVKLPVAALRVGDDLTFVAMAGEVVVDYGRRFKRLFAEDRPWVIGYAYEVPCYIPSARLLKEGGYEPDTSLIYYGIYGPFRGSVEDLVVNRVAALVASLRSP